MRRKLEESFSFKIALCSQNISKVEDVRKMTAKKSCKNGESRVFDNLISLWAFSNKSFLVNF